MSILSMILLTFATQPTSWLAMPMPDGFVIGYQQAAATGAIEERVPAGESVEDWSRMITLLQINAGVPIKTYLSAYFNQLKLGCAGAIGTDQKLLPAGGFEGRFDCPLNPQTGKPETFFYRAVEANGRIHMAQVAFRAIPSAADAQWAQSLLATARLCTDKDEAPICKR